MFAQLKQSVQQNIQVAEAAQGGIAVGGLDLGQAIAVSQRQMLMTFDEIERQANVGIGYAFPAEHVLAEPCMAR
jgi:hypothetical protein